MQQQLIDRYGVGIVRNGGLKVYTTIDPRLQAAAQRAIAGGLLPGSGPAAALVSIDATNGHILAMASSQPTRPPPSSTSPPMPTASPARRSSPTCWRPALKEGMDPDTTYYSGSSPKTLTLTDGTTWTVNNAETARGGR